MTRRKLTRAGVNIRWIETRLLIPEGRDVGKPVKLRDWQKAELRKIYDNKHGTRRAILSFGRKNGKTALAAFIVLLHLCGPEAAKRPNSNLYSAAQSRDQAAILFNLAAKIVRMSADLSSVVTIRDTRKELICRELGIMYRALSAEAVTAFGLSPALIVHDELGQVHGSRSNLYEALETATAAHQEPLSICISTQAPTDGDLFNLLIDDALAGHDPRVVVSLHTAPMDMDPFSEEAIRKANPAFGDFQNANEVRAMARDAKRMPSREAEYRNLILNQRVEVNNPFVTREVWQACNAPVKPIDDVPVYGGLDLSAVNDLTAFVLIGKVDGVWQVHPTFWLPTDAIYERSRTDHVPYDVWHGEGHLVGSPGKSIDYQYVSDFLREAFDRYDIQKIGFDRWNFHMLRNHLTNAGFPLDKITNHFVEAGQGFKWMAPALNVFEAELRNARIAHGGHPVMNMCAHNAVTQMDPTGARKLAKNKSTGRIDGMVALAMAFGVVGEPLEAVAEEPEYRIFVL